MYRRVECKMRWNGKRIVRWCHRNPNIAKFLKKKKVTVENNDNGVRAYVTACNASPKPEFFSFSLFIFSFISELIWVHLACSGWNFQRWFSIQKEINWCTTDPFSYIRDGFLREFVTMAYTKYRIFHNNRMNLTPSSFDTTLFDNGNRDNHRIKSY